MALDPRSPTVEVEDGSPNGGESGTVSTNSIGGTSLSGLTAKMSREVIVAEVRKEASHSATAPPPPQPQARAQERIGESIGSWTGTLRSKLNALTAVPLSAILAIQP